MQKWIVGVAAVLISILSCTQSDKYHNMVKQELASGERHDSLFLGLYLGMPNEDFLDHCYKLNQQQKIYQGSGGLSVFYRLEGLQYSAEMNFYPEFIDGKIARMPAKIHYGGWAPWNRHLQSDSLQLDVLRLFKEWYGEPFMEIKHPEKGSAFVKVDGNRQISIYLLDDQKVMAMFKDLTVEEKSTSDN